MKDRLYSLWRSTLDLHERFGVEFNPGVATQLVIEEASEFLEAMTDVQLNDTEENKQHAAEEAVDVIVVMLAALASVDAIGYINVAVDGVIAKNAAKTHNTHFVSPVTGKITRR